jgi:hypothetical protein
VTGTGVYEIINGSLPPGATFDTSNGDYTWTWCDALRTCFEIA